MMARILAFFMFLTIPATGMAQDNFSDYFRDSSLYMAFTSEAKNKRLRILTIDSLLYQPGWNGPDRLPIKSPSSSHRRILMLSGKDDTIFSHSYSSLIDEWLALGGTHRDYDGSLVMENMMIAANSLGLGSCWIHRAKETFETEEGKQILASLGITEDYVGIGNCILGYAAPEALKTQSPRKKDFVVWAK